MYIITGKHNEAVVFSDMEKIEETAKSQIAQLCDQEFVKGSKIRIMPDVHAGAGCTIGTTMTITDKKIVPNLVGVDIGCGMEVARLGERRINLPELDNAVKKLIPSGFDIRKTEHKFNSMINLEELRYKNINSDRAKKSIGTLGGGNHFIEAAKDKNGHIYLVVHSGSRHLGNELALYYQKEAYSRLPGNAKVPKPLAYAENELFDDYIHDMKIIQKFADINRKAIVLEITKEMKFTVEEQFTTIHNYIDTESMVLRKGAVSAKNGELLIIPMNMRDGSLICTGKGNPEWNYSAPHGAGRLMSRSEAKQSLTLSEFKKTMETAGIYTSSVNKATLDEAPGAYKPMEEITKHIGDTVEILKQITPIYNFKAAE